jgi:drug/metabolite transporter (DMT)-like permease
MIEAVVYGLSCAVCWGTADFVSRRPSREIGYYQTSAFLQLFGFVGLTIYVVLVYPSNLRTTLSNPTHLGINLAIGVLMFIGILFLYKGYSTGIMSVVSPIASCYPAVAITLGVLVLSEMIGLAPIIGIVIILIGIILAGLNISELKSIRSSELVTASQIGGVKEDGRKPPGRITVGVDSALITMVTFGAAVFGLGVVAPVFGFIVPIMIMRGGAAVVAFAVSFAKRQKIVIPHKHTLGLILALALMDSLGFLFLNLGILSAGDVLPIVVTLAGLGSPLTIILARLFYQERLSGTQLLGVGLLLSGVAILLYF